MKRSGTILLLINLFLFADGISQNSSIAFNDKPFNEILAMAGKQNKLIFMDAYASWCGPCKWMAANIFTNDTVAGFFNKNFICVKYDMEKGEGIKLREQYKVRAYPTLLFINAGGNIVHIKVGGFQAVSEYIALGRQAMDPKECYSACMLRYATGENNPAFIFTYLKALSDAYLPVETPLNKYFFSQKVTDLTENSNWRIFYSFSENTDSREFIYLLSHQQEFASRHGKDSVDTKIYNVYLKALIQLGGKTSLSDTGYCQLKQKILASGYDGSEKLFFDADLNIYELQGNFQKIMQLVYKGLDRFYSNDPDMLTNSATLILNLSKDKAYLERASQWAKRSVELKPGIDNNEICAALSFAFGNKDEALKFCRNALIIARRLNAPTEKIEENLKKYESMP